ncbi:MAG: 50S ribosomal protein L4 [Candidatus Pacearchaeota archaeon]|jgi:large subunit ribosomal protein L4e
MKAKILTIDGKSGKEIELPKFFTEKVREDIIYKILEIRKIQHPYGSNPSAGNQSSVSGKIVHKRHAWKSQYGRGMSRVPRKTMSRKGTQFNWVAAGVPNTRGGRRAHPPKAISRILDLKINKKELLLGLKSALSATANEKYLKQKYERLRNKEITKLPLIVESKITELKIRELITSFKKILGTELFEVSIQKKEIRSGIGKLRGRKYKKNAGLLLVLGNDEKLKTTAFDVKQVKELNILDLAKGKPGRLTIYTEKAIKDLENKFSGEKK